jgi:NADH-quinone oxidoreductase subunit A
MGPLRGIRHAWVQEERETIQSHRVQVDYGQFFPFAFFFTILHVVTLVVATSPARTLESLAIALIYVLGAVLGLFILFRR